MLSSVDLLLTINYCWLSYFYKCGGIAFEDHVESTARSQCGTVFVTETYSVLILEILCFYKQQFGFV